MKAGKLLVAVALAALLSAPALAQRAKTAAQGGPQIIVTEANLPQAYTALGAVTANVHPKSMSPKIPTHDLLDAELRKAAAKLGADAVVQVRYILRNPMMSDKGSDAMGVAVKFTSVAAAPAQPAPPAVASAPAQLAAATPPAPVVPPPASAPQVAAAAPVVAPPSAPKAEPQAAPQVAPPSAPVAAPAPPPVAPQQLASATPAPSTPAAAPIAPVEKVIQTAIDPPSPVARHATSVDMILVTDQDYTGRRYTRVGDVRSEVHPKSMFPKTPSRDLLNADMKAQALKLGADAVVLVTYDMHNALTSQRGDIATGVAVRFE